MEHELKIKDNFFRAVDAGKERRHSHSERMVGCDGNYTGRVIRRRITYIYHGTGIYGLAKGYSILGLEKV